MNPNSAQILHQVPYFKVISRPQYWTKIRETNNEMSGISLANHSNKDHLILSYREKDLTDLVELCPKYGFYLLKPKLQASALVLFSSLFASKNPF